MNYQALNCGIACKSATSSHFTEADPEAQRGSATCSESHSQYVREWSPGHLIPHLSGVKNFPAAPVTAWSSGD